MGDNFAAATEVVIPSEGDTFTATSEPNTGYTLESGEDALQFVFAPVFRSAWWRYTPVSSGPISMVVSASTGGSALPSVGLYRGESIAEMADNWIGVSDAGYLNSDVQAGYTYGIQVAAFADEDITYELSVIGGPRSAGAGEVPAPAIGLTLRAVIPASNSLVEAPPGYVYAYTYPPEVTDLDPGLVAAPPALISAVAPPPAGPIIIEAPAALAALTAAVPTVVAVAAFTAAQPADDSTVPTEAPMFVVGVALEYGPAGVVQLAYDDNDDFTSPTTIEFEPLTTEGSPVHRILAAAPLADGTYWWRIRAADDYGFQDWHVYGPFTIDTSALDTAAAGSLTVAAGDPPAHLWFVDPVVGVVGDLVTLYGTGLVGVGTEAVTIDAITAAISGQTTVAATADAYTADRLIDPATPTVTVEHDEIVIAVPDGTDGGGALLLVRG